jgi:sugar lactone lactonase YvrE
MTLCLPVAAWVLALSPLGGAGAAELDEFRVKREAVFAFTEKPAVVRQGDRATITFAVKAFCDATVAIEDAEGRIVRHLGSGVLGPSAPAPFQKNSLKQVVVWDGKNDQGQYVADTDTCAVRVSLGLRARFERTLYWSPHKRIANIAPLLAPAPEGVYVFEGLGVDHLRLFDHQGNYVRTIYPFAAGKLGGIVGLQMHRFPQDGPDAPALPLKVGYEQAALLTSGSSAWGGGGHAGGFAATAIDHHDGKIALAFHKVNRLFRDGTSGGLPVQGPGVSFEVQGYRRRKTTAGPTSITFSPDGKWLYMTGYVWKTGAHVGNADCFHMVMRMRYDRQDAPEVWLGVREGDSGAGSGNDRFCVPTGVAVDPAGRVYVADYLNGRIQVFSPAGEYLKTIRTRHPATVKIDPSSGEVWAFSWPMLGPSNRLMRDRGFDPRRLQPTVTRLGTFQKPRAGKPLPIAGISASTRGGWIATGGQAYKVAVDWYRKVNGQPTLWLVGRKATVSLAEANWMSGAGQWAHLGGWRKRGIHILAFQNGKWEKTFDFAEAAQHKVTRLTPPSFSRARLYVNPADGKLYVCEEQTGAGKSFYSVLRIDPDNGRIEEVRLPFDCEDMVFDIDGRAYLRTDREVVRYDAKTWREIPWDYGEERRNVGFASGGGGTRTHVASALAIPGRRPVWWHSSGMWVSPRGHLAVACNIVAKPAERTPKDKYFNPGIGKPYTPTVYPGRSGSRVIHIFDRHGQLIREDAIPGLTNADGIGIDNEDNLYILVAAPRVFGGERYFNEKSETLVKVRPGKARLLSSDRAPVKLPDDRKPARSADLTKYGMGATWIEGAEWLYGGVGYGGQGGSCVCWHSRFQLDHFARSFAPEVRRYCVAVLDSAGNLILRIGRYGNVEDGKSLVSDGGPAGARSIGGDEVGLFHAAYVGVHTDRRLFIHDAGNGRIASVKLDYHTQARVALKDVPDREGR